MGDGQRASREQRREPRVADSLQQGAVPLQHGVVMTRRDGAGIGGPRHGAITQQQADDDDQHPAIEGRDGRV